MTGQAVLATCVAPLAGGGRLLSSVRVFLEDCKQNKICYNGDILHHNYNGVNMKIISGFTLAEVLITLGIIGVVAALTMPALIGHYKKEETISKLKKAYTILNQAMKRSEVDNGAYEHWGSAFDMGPEEYINKYWVPYFNVTSVCKTFGECGYKTNTPFKKLDGTNDTTVVAHTNLRIPFMTADGIMYSISASSGDASVEDNTIFIDINGGKGPNVHGKDVFMFTRDKNKGILPLCYTNTEESIDNSCSKNGYGYCCAQKIMQDGWKINYPF